MNTNATAQMVTSGGKGCMKQNPEETDQIAAKLGNELWGQRNKLGVEDEADQYHAAHASEDIWLQDIGNGLWQQKFDGIGRHFQEIKTKQSDTQK